MGVIPKRRLRDIVILLPGITGSVLQKNGEDLWSLSPQSAWRTLRTMGRGLQDLKLEGDDPELDDLGDGITATRVMPGAHIVPGLVKIAGYAATVRLVLETFQVVSGSINEARPANFFEFPYDWRRDNRCAARSLKRLIDRQLPLWQEHSGAKDARVILVGHSMGGLVARHYLEVLDGGGWRNCRALITFGTPYRGSFDALGYLANGYKRLFVDLTEVMRSFTSVYQLLPIYEGLRVGDRWARVAETDGIQKVDRARAAQALDFHRAIEHAVTAHQDDPDYRTTGYRVIPIVGTRQQRTHQSAVLTGSDLTVGPERPTWIDSELGDGDGTVPMVSAIPIELPGGYHETFIPERHSYLQMNPTVLNDLRVRLSLMQTTALGEIRGPAPSVAAAERPAISLDIDDLYVAGEPIVVRAALVNTPDPSLEVEALVEPVSGDAPVTRHRFRDEGGEQHLTLEGLPSGTYRIEVEARYAGPEAPSPVHDVFEVLA